MIVTGPADTPVTYPVNEPIVTAVVLLLHQPPGTPSLNVVFAPVHTVAAPVIGVGEELTVMIFVAMQPVGSV